MGTQGVKSCYEEHLEHRWLPIFRTGLSVGLTFVLSAAVARTQERSTRTPDLSQLTTEERQSIESACSGAKYVQGPAAYNQCLRSQPASLSQEPRKPDPNQTGT